MEKATGSVVISLFIISDWEGHRKCCCRGGDDGGGVCPQTRTMTSEEWLRRRPGRGGCAGWTRSLGNGTTAWLWPSTTSPLTSPTTHRIRCSHARTNTRPPPCPSHSHPLTPLSLSLSLSLTHTHTHTHTHWWMIWSCVLLLRMRSVLKTSVAVSTHECWTPRWTSPRVISCFNSTQMLDGLKQFKRWMYWAQADGRKFEFEHFRPGLRRQFRFFTMSTEPTDPQKSASVSLLIDWLTAVYLIYWWFPRWFIEWMIAIGW